MTGESETGRDDVAQRVAVELDAIADVGTDVLAHRVSRDGVCGWLGTAGEEPAWTGDDVTDRALAAPICAGCPVQRECLELELRLAGYATAGVWGPLSEQDRRVVHLVWSDRRDLRDGDESGVYPAGSDRGPVERAMPKRTMGSADDGGEAR